MLRAHGMRWKTVAEFAAALPQVDVARLRDVSTLGPGELVKDSTVRTVARLLDPLDPGGPGLYVKRYKFRDLRDRVRHLVVASKPIREWRVCRALQRADIATCDVLAIAVRRYGGMPREGFLVSRGIPRVVELRDWLAVATPADRTGMVEELAVLTARMADEGFYHHDYHAGNLLVQEGAPSTGLRAGRLYVVDLHSIRLRRPRRRHILRMLAMLDNSTRPVGVTDEDRTAFLRVFLERWRGGPGLSEESLERWSAWCCEARDRLHRRHMASRTRRCLLRSSLFEPGRAGGYRMHRRRDLPARCALEAIRAHDQALAGNADGCEVLRDGRKTQVSIVPCRAVPPLDGSRPADAAALRPGRVCVKAFLRRSPWQWLKELLRPRGRARTAWVASRGFNVRGIPAPRPLALLENRLRGADYLITEAVEHEGRLHDLALRGLPAGPPRRRLAEAVAALLCKMAEEEVIHPDMKPSNLLVQKTDGRFKLCPVDLDRARFGAKTDRAQWVKCLAQLNAGLAADVSVLDRMRCLRACGRGRWSRAERLAIAREVHALSLTRKPVWLRAPCPHPPAGV